MSSVILSRFWSFFFTRLLFILTLSLSLSITHSVCVSVSVSLSLCPSLSISISGSLYLSSLLCLSFSLSLSSEWVYGETLGFEAHRFPSRVRRRNRNRSVSYLFIELMLHCFIPPKTRSLSPSLSPFLSLAFFNILHFLHFFSLPLYSPLLLLSLRSFSRLYFCILLIVFLLSFLLFILLVLISFPFLLFLL